MTTNITMKKLIILALAALFLMPGAQVVAQEKGLHKPIKIEKQWKKYDPGKVFFKDKSPETEGSKLYHQIVKDPDSYIRENALRVLQTLYYGPNDPNIPKIKSIYYNLEQYDGVSEKSGNGDHVAIRYSTNWVERAQREAAKDPNSPVFHGIKGGYKVDYETRGVIYHELTHAYQLEPRGAGRYDGKSECWSFIEGLADGVRVACGCFSHDYMSKDRPRKGNWRTGYRVSGYFLFWLQQNKDKDFLRKFNASAAELDRWSWDAACRHILGEGVVDLWKQYKQSIGEELQPDELTVPNDEPRARREGWNGAMPAVKAVPYEESWARGKQIAVFGGSFSVIPESDVTKKYWEEKLDCHVTNYGIGGAGFSITTGDDRWISLQIDRALATDTKYDIFILWASTNDVARKVSVEDQNRLIGEAIDKLKSARPDAKILFFTSLPVPMLEHMQNIGEYVRGQQMVCREKGIPCLNLFRESGINGYNAPDFFQGDKLHLNREGYNHIKELQARFIATEAK